MAQSWISDRNDFSSFFILCRIETFILQSFKSIGVSVQEKKRKVDFQDGCHGGHLGFLIGTILATFDLQVNPMLHTEFQVNWPFGSGGEAIGTILAIFYLQLTPMLPTKFRVNWPYDSGGEAKNIFSGWRPSWISDRNNFSNF